MISEKSEFNIWSGKFGTLYLRVFLSFRNFYVCFLSRFNYFDFLLPETFLFYFTFLTDKEDIFYKPEKILELALE